MENLPAKSYVGGVGVVGGVRSTKGEAGAMGEGDKSPGPVAGEIDDLVEKCWEKIRQSLKVERESLVSGIVDSGARPVLSSEPEEQETRESPPAALKEDPLPEARVGVRLEPPVSSVGTRRVISNSTPEDAKLFEGRLRVEIIPPFGRDHMESLPDWLAQLPGLTVISTGGYAGRNRWVTSFLIDLKRPAPLLKIIEAAPHVRSVAQHYGSLVIELT